MNYDQLVDDLPNISPIVQTSIQDQDLFQDHYPIQNHQYSQNQQDQDQDESQIYSEVPGQKGYNQVIVIVVQLQQQLQKILIQFQIILTIAIVLQMLIVLVRSPKLYLILDLAIYSCILLGLVVYLFKLQKQKLGQIVSKFQKIKQFVMVSGGLMLIQIVVSLIVSSLDVLVIGVESSIFLVWGIVGYIWESNNEINEKIKYIAELEEKADRLQFSIPGI